ncbi:serine protease protein [Lasius niger]|uniref:Serine protease protein n=1 Tax=Lasius niger TaxID=67767 RepID=A0A0J7KMM8_LASNI|nr:serine protease protein [Lasius niger]
MEEKLTVAGRTDFQGPAQRGYRPSPAVSSSYDGPAVGFEESPAVETIITSTGGFEEIAGTSGRDADALLETVRNPELRLVRVEEIVTFRTPLPQRQPRDRKKQEKLGAPAAGVEGITVPGAPSSSYEGPTAVSTAGTAAELATIGEISDPAETVEDLFLGRPSWLDEINPDLGNKEMETQEEEISKKRKADVSPVISISSGEDVVAPYSLRGSRKCRIVDSPEEDKIDLTRLSETPIRSDDASGADMGVGVAGSSGGKKKRVSVGYKTKKSLVQEAPSTSKIDLKPELD